MIGSGFGREPLPHTDNMRAELFEQRGDDVIPPEQDAMRFDLRLEVPVTDMPGKLGEMQAVSPPHFHQVFFGCNDLDELAVVEHKRIAMTERNRIFELDPNFRPFETPEQFAAEVAIRRFEFDRIERRAGMEPRPKKT